MAVLNLTVLPELRYGLVTQQTKGTYKYFADLGDRMEVAVVNTKHVDEVYLKFLVPGHHLLYFRTGKRKWGKQKWSTGWDLVWLLLEKAAMRTRRKMMTLLLRLER